MYYSYLRHLSKTASFLPGLFTVSKRPIHTAILREFNDGTFIASIRNDGGNHKNEREYMSSSISQFHGLLRNDTLHIYVDKTKVSKTGFNSIGHISGFLTNSDGKVLEESFISLRTGKTTQKSLVFRLPKEESKRNTTVFDIEFYKFDQEFTKHLFKFDANFDFTRDRKRFLIGVPLSIVADKISVSKNDFIELAKETKRSFADKKFIIYSGYIDGEFFDPINCVTAFYNAVGVQGKESDPSPQMAAWSYLRLILGDSLRDKLIDGTGLRESDSRERTHDDELSIKSFKN